MADVSFVFRKGICLISGSYISDKIVSKEENSFLWKLTKFLRSGNRRCFLKERF